MKQFTTQSQRSNMCPLTFNKLFFLVFVLLYTETKCTCRQSYVTFCDDLSDLGKYNVENWTELVVGSEDADSSQLRLVDFNTLFLERFDKLISLVVVRQIKDIKSYTFALDREDTKVEYLSMYGNEIKRIRFTTFDAMKLRKLSLVNNSIEYIHKEAFYNCEIETIDLSHNKLEMVEGEVFSDDFLIENATKEIIMRNNKLESIVPLSFPSSLVILNLDYNSLGFIPYTVFDNLINLQELTLSHNKIHSLPDLKKLKELIVIDASYNDIESLNAGDFNNLTYLEVLDLSHNKISYPLIFQYFNFPQRHPSLQISLAFNKLTHLIIGNDSFRDHIVFLYGNPWDCKCWSILEKFMVDNKVKRNKCDLQFFGNGQTPYCIGFGCTDCTKAQYIDANYTDSDRKQFLDVIRSRQDSVNCSLSPKRL